jgi:hypothetical protein
MDEMRNRYKATRRDYSLPTSRAGQAEPNRPAPPSSDEPITIHESLRAAYQPPPTHHPPADKPKHTHPVAVPAAALHPKAIPKNRRLWRRLAAAVVIIGVLGGASAWAYPKYLHQNPFPADIRSSAEVSLLYPAKLPPGYSVDRSSIHIDNNFLIYNANNGSKRIVFTLQKVPAGFDYNKFYQTGLSGAQQFHTALGQGAIGKFQDRFLGSLTSGNTWLLLSDNSPGVSRDELRLTMDNLKQY